MKSKQSAKSRSLHPLDGRTAEELCLQYKAELARLYGTEIADASRCDYSGGWFYINKASRYQDGSVGDGSHMTRAFRRSNVTAMIATLRGRSSSIDGLHRLAEGSRESQGGHSSK